MIPATCAVARASPFGNSRNRRAVSGAIRTVARATARRRESGLPPTSTMRTSPPSVTWLNSPMPWTILTTSRRAHPVGRSQQGVCPPIQVVLAHVRADGVEPPTPLVGIHRQGILDRLGLAIDLERVDGPRPFTHLCVCAGVFR